MKKKIVSSSSWEKKAANFLSISPLDGRNFHKLEVLSNYFSELALNRQRMRVEIEYLVFLAEIGVAPKLTKRQVGLVLGVVRGFNIKEMEKVREFEKKTNHDVKAVEYYLRSKLKKLRLDGHGEWIHWGLTSEDTNNLSYNLNVKDYLREELLSLLELAMANLERLISRSDNVMLARTHGQPAGVTTLAKELAVYYKRLGDEIAELKRVELKGKVTGAVGSLGDQHFSFPKRDWLRGHSKFIKSLGLEVETATTQLLPYDSLIRVFDSLSRLQEVAIDLCQNLWWYASLGYLDQQAKKGEVGSSVMPQKLNPIYLEGAEGGFGIANALMGFYKSKLMKSRLQRDLSDSTVRRSFGIAFGYSYLSFQSLAHGLALVLQNKKAMRNDLEKHYEVLTSSVQTYLKTRGVRGAFEKLLKKVKGRTLSKDEYIELIDTLGLEAEVAEKLREIEFENLKEPSEQIVAAVIGGRKK